MNKESQLMNISSESDSIQEKTNIKKWRNPQKVRYLLFLVAYQQDLQKDFSTIQKSFWYSKLSQFIGNVSPAKCGEYHMSKLASFGSIRGIIDYLISKILIFKQQLTKETQRVKQIIQKDSYFPKKQNQESNNNENELQIIKFQQLIQDINSQPSSEQQPNNQNFYQEIPNQHSEIFAQGMIIIQRDVPFRYSNLKKQEQKIQKIISIFKNYQPQVNDFIKFKNYCLGIMMKEAKQQRQQKQQKSIKQDVNFDKSLQIFFCDKEDANNQQQSEEIENKPTNYQRPQPKFKRQIFWNDKQRMKLITFLHIVKEEYKTKNQFIYKKCSQYLDSDKSPNECKQKILQLCQKYSDQYQKMLQNETIKLQISQQMIEEKRLEYIMKEKSLLRCEIKVQFQPIKIIKQKTESQIKKYKKDKFALKTPTIVLLQFHPLSLQNQQRQKIIKNKEQKVEAQKIKYFLHLKVSNKIFTIIKYSAKDEIPFQQSNFIILIKKSHIKLTIQNIENKKQKFDEQKVCQISQKYKESQFIEKQFAINNFTSMKYKNLIMPTKIFPKMQIGKVKSDQNSQISNDNFKEGFTPRKKLKKQ